MDRLNDDIEPNWVFGGETVFFAFTLLATIGYGHLSPLTQYGKIFCMVYATIGVPITCLVLTSIVERLERLITRNSPRPYQRLTDSSNRYRNYSTIPTRLTTPTHQVNIYLRTFIVAVLFFSLIYAAPAYVLTNFTEFDWSYLDSVYYTYISITTIGFGDLVPGEDQPKDYRNVYRSIITGWLYYLKILTVFFKDCLALCLILKPKL